MAILPYINSRRDLFYNSDRGSRASLQKLCQKFPNYWRSETEENFLLRRFSYAFDFAVCASSRNWARRQADCEEKWKRWQSYFKRVLLQIYPENCSRSATGPYDLDLAQLYSCTPSAVFLQPHCQKSGPADLGSHAPPSFLFGVLWNPWRSIIRKFRVPLCTTEIEQRRNRRSLFQATSWWRRKYELECSSSLFKKVWKQGWN